MKIEAGQWWETRGGNRVSIVGVAAENVDYPVFGVMRHNKEFYSNTYTRHGKYSDLRNESKHDLVKHLPDCTGWDWEPPKPVEAGEGWRLLVMREVIRLGDEWWDDYRWAPVDSKNANVPLVLHDLKVRRRIQPDIPSDWKLVGGVPGGMLYFRSTEGT